MYKVCRKICWSIRCLWKTVESGSQPVKSSFINCAENPFYSKVFKMIINGIMTSSNIADESDEQQKLLDLLQKCNSFFIQGLTSIHGECHPFIVCGRQVGVIRPDVAPYLQEYPQIFIKSSNSFFLHPRLDSYFSRSEALDIVLRDLRTKDVFPALKGWREEAFNVWTDFGSEALFKIERSAVTLFGLRAFGIHINGFTRQSDGSYAIWLQKRAANKPTWPGAMDSMVGGGITAGLTPSQVLLKEAAEEASIPEYIVKKAKSAGTVSFFTETERGLHANTEFVYDLELDADFIPMNSDGEVQGFELVPLQELLGRVLSSKYKMTSAPVAIDFLVRHGIINAETNPNLPAIQELIHLPLHQLYRRWPLHHLSSIQLPSIPSISITEPNEGS